MFGGHQQWETGENGETPALAFTRPLRRPRALRPRADRARQPPPLGEPGPEPGIARAHDRARRALVAVGLEARGSVGPGSVGPGSLTTLELRVLEVARGLGASPELILLDEPLAGLSRAGVEL
ncbi:MAG TPA: hypothetical protein VML54_12795 [Candidatus Limnocylindrales bacterium]|nr:hypothetical protein [Candidatus Limnocylindrales bacterium]